MRHEGGEKVERFNTSGRGTGAIALVAIGAFLLYGLVNRDAGFAPWSWPLLLLIAAVLWTVLIRPCICVDRSMLELRNILHSRWIPLARITSVAVTQVTVVRADDRKYVATGVGRSRRQIHRDQFRRGEPDPLERQSAGSIIEHRLNRLAEQAREISHEEPPAIRRTWAWPEICVIAVLAVATVVLYLV